MGVRGRFISRSICAPAFRAAWSVVAVIGLLSISVVASTAPTTQPEGAARAHNANGKRIVAATAPAATQSAAAKVPLPPAVPSVTDGQAIHRRPGATTQATTRPVTGALPTAAPQAYEFRRMVLALGAVIALIFALRWVAKRVFVMPGSSRASRAVQVLSRSPLAPKQQVMLLQVGRRIVVVADSAGTMSTLCQIEDPDEVTSLLAQIMAERGMATPKAFGSVFGRSRARFDEAMEEPADSAIIRTGVLDGEEPLVDGAPEDPAVGETRSEIQGLMDKVRRMSSQFRASRGETGT